MAAKTTSPGKRIRYPNGKEGVVSDSVAEILGKREGHKILGKAKARTADGEAPEGETKEAPEGETK